jgi:two-component system, sensor histidine kinase
MIQRKKIFLTAILESIGDGVVATDISGNITFFNDAAEEITGWSINEVMNRKFYELFIFIDGITNQIIESPVNNALNLGKQIGLQENTVLITKQRERKYISANVSVIKEETGTISGTVMVFRDITRIRSAELSLIEEKDNFIRVFNSAPVGIIALDENELISEINEAAFDFLQSNGGVVIGKKFGDAFFCEEGISNKRGCGFGFQCKSCEIKRATQAALKFGLSTKNIEFNKMFVIGDENKERWFKASITPIKYEEKRNAVIVLIDITDRKDKETELQKSRDFYLSMFENFPTMIWKSDISGRSIYSGRRWNELVGKDKNESLGLSWIDVIHPEDRERVNKIHEDSVSNRQPYDIEYRVQDNAGKYRWIQSINRPFFDINGNYDGHIGIGLDITDRKVAEEGLNRYTILSGKVRDIIHFIDTEGNIIDVNQSGIEAYGYDYKEFVKLNIRDIRAEGVITAEFLQKCDQEGAVYETVHYRKDKSTFPVEISAKGVDICGKRVIVSIIRDITERKQTELALKESEEKFRSLFNNASDAVYVYEINNNFRNEIFMEVNNAASTYLGYTKEELLTMSFYDISGEQNKENVETFVAELQKYGKGIFETKHRTKDNRVIDVEVNVQTFNRNGKKVAQSIVRDITQRKSEEVGLKAAKEAAEIASKTKSEFLANMSHEIRTPINGIVGMVDLTLLTELNSEQRENLMIVKSCANSLLKVINDILDFSKMEAGKLNIENINFDIKSLIEDTIKAHSQRAVTKGIELNYAFSSTIPQYVVGDPSRVQQILNNLISNAIKFTESGEVWVKVKKIRTHEGEVEVQFSVEDTGIGIAEENIGKLFESFSQVDGSITRRFGGTGLGLAISKQLAELMGGRLWVESEKDKGSKFYFTLEFMIGTSIKTYAAEAYKPKKVEDSCKVLLTEDDKVNQMVISRILKERGYSIDTACNGLEAVHMCEKNSYDIILMDIQMPVMDGIEAAKRIREGNIHTPIIAITAYALNGDRERFLAQGMDGYVSKPIKVEELFSTIEKCLLLNGRSDNFTNIDICFDESGEVVLKPKDLKVFGKNDSLLLNKLEDAIEALNKELVQGEFSLIEPLAHKIKDLSNEIGIEELKTIAFKMELAARRGDFEKLIERGQKASHIFEVFKKSIL